MQLPEQAAPGETVQVHYPASSSRGVAFALEERAESGWNWQYILIAGRRAAPGWFAPGDELAWPHLAVEGPGPDLLVIPEVAVPGEYRICTVDAGEDFCAVLEVRD